MRNLEAELQCAIAALKKIESGRAIGYKASPLRDIATEALNDMQQMQFVDDADTHDCVWGKW